MLNNYAKEDTKKCLFTDENYFDLGDVCNVQNDRMRAVSREETDIHGGIHQKAKFPTKVIV